MVLAAGGRWLKRRYFDQRIGLGCLKFASACFSTAPEPIRALLAAHQQRASEDESPTVQIAGFARSIRTHRKLTFINLTDGSLPAESTLQAVIKGDAKEKWDSQLSIGVALELTGRLQASKGANQSIEFAVDQLSITGQSQASTYPLASSQVTLPSSTKTNLLRKYAHLRPRDARHASVLRTRNVIEKSISDYFWDQGFIRVAAPIITSSDCEDGGEVFKVDAAHEIEESDHNLDEDLAQEPSLSGSTPDQPPEQDQSLKVEPSLSGSEGDASAISARTNKRTSFWSDSEAYLTVSSQLHLEAMTLGLGRVYTVGPSFRAESSATNRHLAEFWMCEGEMVTSSNASVALGQVMDVVEGLIKQIVDATIKCEEAGYLWAGDEEGLTTMQEMVLSQDKWPRMTYSEAVKLLREEQVSSTIAAPEWGESLASEHERWLAREGPIFITHYPASIKPFYMRQDEGAGERASTVACFDLLVPKIGELVGGSLREERKEIMAAKLASSANPHLQWYVDDLRRYGCNPHGGFGLGMERLLSLVTKTDNLRDCLTFPRVKGPVRF